MQHFITILFAVTLPLVALVAVGWAIQPHLKLHIPTLTALQINVVLPAFFVHYLSTSALPLEAAWPMAWFTVLQFFILLAVGWGIARTARIDPADKPVVAIAQAFPNTGNYGIPLATLVFVPTYLLHQSVIVAIQTVIIIAACTILLAPNGPSWRQIVRPVVTSPMIWGIAAGLALRAFEVRLPTAIAIPAELIGRMFVPMALITLGASLSQSARSGLAWLFTPAVQLAVWPRMVLAPLLTLLLALACGFTGEDLVFLTIAASAPVGVLLAVFCLDVRGEAETASAAVFLSTLISPITVTAWLVALRAVGF